MRIAVVSDIHGNLTALEAVIADLAHVAPDLVVQGGDLVGSGSSPAEVIDRIRELKWPGVRGNTDEMLWLPDKVDEMLAAPYLQRVRDMLVTHTIPATLRAIGDQRLAWLKTVPVRWSMDDLAVVHAGPDDPWRSPPAKASDDDLASAYGPLAARRVVYGHIHEPFVRRLPAFIVANSGSVGLPYDGDPQSSYLVIDGDAFEIRRVAYDIEEEVSRLVAAKDPYAEWQAQMLRTGRPAAMPAA